MVGRTTSQEGGSRATDGRRAPQLLSGDGCTGGSWAPADVGAYLERITSWQARWRRLVYNEFIIDGAVWEDNLPLAIEAIFNRPDVHSAFVAKFGYDPPMKRWPMPTVRSDDSASYGPRVAVLAGIDLVAYHSLQKGQHDVRGSPAHRRWLNSSLVLPPPLRAFHPLPYEFWFSNAANALAFEADPYRFLPAFGGHCTHGIASRGDLNRSLLADGRMALEVSSH